MVVYFHCPSGKIKTSGSGQRSEVKEPRARNHSGPLHHEGKPAAHAGLIFTVPASSQRCRSYCKTVSNSYFRKPFLPTVLSLSWLPMQLSIVKEFRGTSKLSWSCRRSTPVLETSDIWGSNLVKQHQIKI